MGKYWFAFCEMWERNDQKLLGFNNDRNLKFSYHISKQWKKAGRKLSPLTKTYKFMSLKRRRILIKSFIESQFV